MDRPIKISNKLSHSPFRLELCRRTAAGETMIGAIATAFIWQTASEFYLITNWHNATGWNLETNRALLENGFVPDFVQFVLDFVDVVEANSTRRKRIVKTIELLDQEGKANWFEHPEFGARVDVVAMSITKLIDGKLMTLPINRYSDFSDFESEVGDDAFVLGFPKGIDAGTGFPLWKKASIASEPDIDLNKLPMLYIDATTRPGMSGAPVVLVKRGFVNPRGVTGISGETMLGTSEAFLGVYSGRVADDPMGAQIGIVWKARVIDEIIAGQVRGRAPHNAE